jgi:hypothetical protein
VDEHVQALDDITVVSGGTADDLLRAQVSCGEAG